MWLVILSFALGVVSHVVFGFLRKDQRRKAVALAIREELRGTHFNPPVFGGFASQAHDTFFADIPTLPEETAEKVLRYYARMKYLKGRTFMHNEPSVKRMEEIRDDLLELLAPGEVSGKTRNRLVAKLRPLLLGKGRRRR